MLSPYIHSHLISYLLTSHVRNKEVKCKYGKIKLAIMSVLATLCVLEKPECGADYFQSISRIQYVD